MARPSPLPGIRWSRRAPRAKTASRCARVETGSVILDRDLKRRVRILREDPHARPRPFACVVEQIAQHLLEVRGLAGDPGARCDVDLHGNAALRGDRAQDADQGIDAGRNLGLPAALLRAGLGPCAGQLVLDHGLHAQHRRADSVDLIARDLAQPICLHEQQLQRASTSRARGRQPATALARLGAPAGLAGR